MARFPKKKIVRLKRGSKAYLKLQLSVLRRDGFICQECFLFTQAPPHHIKKLSQGGSDVLDNMVCLCGPMENDCHRKVHDEK